MQGEVIRTTCQQQLVALMGPGCFDSCYSWWPHHVKSIYLSSETEQRAASTAANRLKEENIALPVLTSSLSRKKRTLSLKALIYFSMQWCLNKKEDPDSWIPSLCAPQIHRRGAKLGWELWVLSSYMSQHLHISVNAPRSGGILWRCSLCVKPELQESLKKDSSCLSHRENHKV